MRKDVFFIQLRIVAAIVTGRGATNVIAEIPAADIDAANAEYAI